MLDKHDKYAQIEADTLDFIRKNPHLKDTFATIYNFIETNKIDKKKLSINKIYRSCFQKNTDMNSAVALQYLLDKISAGLDLATINQLFFGASSENHESSKHETTSENDTKNNNAENKVKRSPSIEELQSGIRNKMPRL